MRYAWITLLCVLFIDATSAFAAPFLYVPNRGDDTVSVIDTETNAVIATVDVGRAPTLIKAHPFGTFVYVYNSGTISVIDTSSNAVVSTVSDLQEDQSGAVDMAVHPAGTVLYTVNLMSLSVIDAVNHVFIEEIDVPGNSWRVTVHPAGMFLYVISAGNKEVIVVDTATLTVVTRVPVDQFPMAMAIHPDGRFLYVGSATSTVSVIDTATNTVVANVFVGLPDVAEADIRDIQVHPEGTFVYVNDFGFTEDEGSVYVVDALSNTVIGNIPVQNSHLALHPEGTFLYTSDLSAGTVSVIDTATNTVIETITVGNIPKGMAITQPVPRQISGCVDLGGVPLVQHNVTLKQADEAKQKTTTDANGCYAFESIASGKTFKVIIKGPAIP